jgi:hypothetical protein
MSSQHEDVLSQQAEPCLFHRRRHFRTKLQTKVRSAPRGIPGAEIACALAVARLGIWRGACSQPEEPPHSASHVLSKFLTAYHAAHALAVAVRFCLPSRNLLPAKATNNSLCSEARRRPMLAFHRLHRQVADESFLLEWMSLVRRDRRMLQPG